MAILSNMPGRAVNFGDPNSVQQLLSTLSSNPGDLAAHMDKKTSERYCEGFRIGAAATAAAAGLPAWLIKILGCWRSDSYERYIHLPQATILQVPTTMVTYHQNHNGVENLTTFDPWK